MYYFVDEKGEEEAGVPAHINNVHVGFCFQILMVVQEYQEKTECLGPTRENDEPPLTLLKLLATTLA